MKKAIHRDVWVGAVLALFSCYVIYLARQIQGDANVVPTALAIGMLLCAVMILIKGVAATKLGNGEYQYAMKLSEAKYPAIYMLFIVGYYLMFRYITYWIATPIFMIASMKYLGVKKWWVNILVTVITTAICFIIFVLVLKLPIYKIGILGKYFRVV